MRGWRSFRRSFLTLLAGLWWGTLDRYALRRFLLIYAANLVSFTSIFVLVDAVEHLDEFTRNAGAGGGFLRFCARYYAALFPVIYVQLLGPVVCLTAGLFTMTLFQRANELVPVLASGRPCPRVFWPLLVASLGFSALAFAIEESWIPSRVEQIHQMVQLRKGQGGVDNIKYWDIPRGNLIVINRYYPHARTAQGVTVLPVVVRAREFYIQARAMRWVRPDGSRHGRWVLEDGVVQEYGPDGRLVVKTEPETPEQPALLLEEFVERELDTTLAPEDIEVRERQVVYMTLSNLRRKMRQSGCDRRWAIKYFSRFTYPLNNTVLLLLGLPVIVALGGRNIFFGALVATVVAAAFYLVTSFATDLGVRGLLPASLGVGLGPIFFAALGLTWWRFMRT